MLFLDLTLRDLACSRAQPYVIGRRGTAGVLTVRLDYSDWVRAYGPGVITLMVKPYGAGAAYPVALEDSHGLAAWPVSILDTQTAGIGMAEFIYHPDSSSVDKSVVLSVAVLPDIGRPLSEIPDAYEDWVSRLEQLGAETLLNAQNAAESASEAAESAEAALDAKNAAEAAQQAAEGSERAAAGSAEAAAESESNAEAWAVGERGGEPVPSGDVTYQNNAKFFAEVAQQGATESGFAWFDVNDETGEMIVTITPSLADSVAFAVNENTGELEVIL